MCEGEKITHMTQEKKNRCELTGGTKKIHAHTKSPSPPPY